MVWDVVQHGVGHMGARSGAWFKMKTWLGVAWRGVAMYLCIAGAPSCVVENS